MPPRLQTFLALCSYLAFLAVCQAQAPGIIPGEYLVVVDREKANVAEVAARIRFETGADVEIVAGDIGILKIELPPDTGPQASDAMTAAALNIPGVVAVENNAYDQLYGTPLPIPPSERQDGSARTSNDPLLANCWYLGPIDTFEAWDRDTTSSVIVAVVDSGYVFNHEDLADAWLVNVQEFPPNGLDDDGNGFVDDYAGWDFQSNDNNPYCELFDDTDGFTKWESHGSHVAGSIGATGNNGLGIAGMSWDVELMLLRAGAGRSVGIGAASSAVQYAVNNGAKIVNCSFGGPSAEATKRAWMQYAASKGALVVVAAGNAGVNVDVTPDFPAGLGEPNQVTVAALGLPAANSLASFSNYGAAKVHLATPGVDILSTVPGPNTADPGTNGYEYSDGTSMASPITAGAAALVWSQNPSMTYAEVKQILLDNVDHLASLSGKCVTGGRLNVDKAVKAAAGLTNLPPSLTTIAPVSVECAGGQNLVQLSTVATDPELRTLKVDWYVDGVLRHSQSNVASGSTASFTWNYAHGESTVVAEASDEFASVQETTTVTVSDTTTPIVMVTPTVRVSVDRGEVFASYWRIPLPYVSDVCDPSPAIYIDAPTQLPIGSTVVQWYVFDDEGNWSSAAQRVDVVNAKPRADAGRNLSLTTKSRTASAKLNGRGSTDSDGHSLSYRWTGNGVRFSDSRSSRPRGTFPVGTSIVTLTVTDEAGAKATDTVRVVVRKTRVRSDSDGLADTYAGAAYSRAYLSAAGRAFDPAAVDAYVISERAYLLGQYAGDDDAELRLLQAEQSRQAAELFFSSYEDSGDAEALLASIYSYYGAAYGRAGAGE